MSKNVIYDEAKKQFALEENSGGGDSVTWTTIEGKPDFVAEGDNAAAARAALGLGTAATTASTAYATAAQGLLAETALQPGDLIPEPPSEGSFILTAEDGVLTWIPN